MSTNKNITEVNKGSISSIINSAMEAKGIDKEKLAKRTLISDHFIDMLLNGNFKKLPPRPYAHGYVVKIASVLNIDSEDLWQKYLEQSGVLRSSGEQDKLPSNRFLVSGLNIKAIAWSLLGIIIASYVIWQIFFSFSISRVLTLEGLDNDIMITDESSITIKGEVDQNFKLSINDEDVFTGNEGNFEKILSLTPGLNTLVFKIQSPLGKKDEMIRQVFYEHQEEEEEIEMEIETNQEELIINPSDESGFEF